MICVLRLVLGITNLIPLDEEPTTSRFFFRKSSAEGDKSSKVAAYAGDRYPSSGLQAMELDSAFSFFPLERNRFAGEIFTPRHVVRSSALLGDSQYSFHNRFCSTLEALGMVYGNRVCDVASVAFMDPSCSLLLVIAAAARAPAGLLIASHTRQLQVALVPCTEQIFLSLL